jgi:hypothetical protein
MSSSPESRSPVKEKGSPGDVTDTGSSSRSIESPSSGVKSSQVLSVTSSSDESEEGMTSGKKHSRPLRNGTSIPSSINIANLEKFKKSLRLTSDQIVS